MDVSWQTIECKDKTAFSTKISWIILLPFKIRTHLSWHPKTGHGSSNPKSIINKSFMISFFTQKQKQKRENMYEMNEILFFFLGFSNANVWVKK